MGVISVLQAALKDTASMEVCPDCGQQTMPAENRCPDCIESR